MIKSLSELSRLITVNKRCTSTLYSIIDNYKGGDWKNHINKSNNGRVEIKESGYSKILLPYECGYYNIYLLKWSYGATTPIHSHMGGCIFKMLYGSMNQSIYTLDKKTFIYQEKLHINDTKYIDDNIGLHKMKNITKKEDLSEGMAYSMHIYPSHRFYN